MSQTEYYFQIPNFGLFTGYMTKYSAYATMLKLKMSRTEYYYGATRGQITLLRFLLCTGRSVSRPITCHVKGTTSNMKMTQLGGTLRF